MNMKLIPQWLLVVCIVIGSLVAPTEGANLEWDDSVEVDDGKWKFKLLNVPSRGHPWWGARLSQLLPNGDWEEIESSYKDSVKMFGSPVPKTVNIPFAIKEGKFKGDNKIVKAEVAYSDGEVLESDSVDLDALLEDIIAETVGGVVGGLVFLILVIGCILCVRRRRRLVLIQQPVMQQPVAVVVPQTVPQVMYV